MSDSESTRVPTATVDAGTVRVSSEVDRSMAAAWLALTDPVQVGTWFDELSQPWLVSVGALPLYGSRIVVSDHDPAHTPAEVDQMVAGWTDFFARPQQYVGTARSEWCEDVDGGIELPPGSFGSLAADTAYRWLPIGGRLRFTHTGWRALGLPEHRSRSAASWTAALGQARELAGGVSS